MATRLSIVWVNDMVYGLNLEDDRLLNHVVQCQARNGDKRHFRSHSLLTMYASERKTLETQRKEREAHG